MNDNRNVQVKQVRSFAYVGQFGSNLYMHVAWTYFTVSSQLTAHCLQDCGGRCRCCLRFPLDLPWFAISKPHGQSSSQPKKSHWYKYTISKSIIIYLARDFCLMAATGDFCAQQLDAKQCHVLLLQFIHPSWAGGDGSPPVAWCTLVVFWVVVLTWVPMNDWWVVYLDPWKIWVRQLGWLFPIYGKRKSVPNHQPNDNWSEDEWNAGFPSESYLLSEGKLSV